MRKLSVEDMRRAHIPERFWQAKMNLIPDQLAFKQDVKSYMDKMPQMMEEGIGLYLWSPRNSTGKTALSTLVARCAMRHGFTVLFIPSFDLIRSTFDKTPFDHAETLFQRAHSVDLLIIDDIDKEYKDAKGYSDATVENVIRSRVQQRKATLMTSNLEPKKLKELYSLAMTELLRESVITIEVYGTDKGGKNWRAERESYLKTLL